MKKINSFLIIPLALLGTMLYFICSSNTTAPQKNRFPCGVPLNRITYHKKNDKGFEMVFVPFYKWEKKELKVYFTDIEDLDLMGKTLNVANRWSTEAGAKVKFVLTASIIESDIRIAFRDKNGYQSLIGNEAGSLEYASVSTMSLQNLDSSPDAEFIRVVLHEFGHAIGLEHELQNPNVHIVWDTSAVYSFYRETYNWDSAKVNFNVFGKINTKEATVFDPQSIMIYAVPAFLLKDKIEIPWPDKLSAIDKKTIK